MTHIESPDKKDNEINNVCLSFLFDCWLVPTELVVLGVSTECCGILGLSVASTEEKVSEKSIRDKVNGYQILSRSDITGEYSDRTAALT